MKSPLPAGGESVGFLWTPLLTKNADAKHRLCEARVRGRCRESELYGYTLSPAERPPHPTLSPHAGRGRPRQEHACPPPPQKQKTSGCSATTPRQRGAAAALCKSTRATPMWARSAARATTVLKDLPCTTCAIRRRRKKSANSARRPASIATSCASSATICST